MLNYLLLQLVGPNKKNLKVVNLKILEFMCSTALLLWYYIVSNLFLPKVNDQKEYAFDPANLVLDICEIYVNLSENKSFTLAVSQDGRSYSTDLFKLADNVLGKIFFLFINN